ncbi:MAG: hypothetical protein HRU26_07765 [Psychroserpens sp.]|nr:hypothetical protein [Psychroserpens sp.]
MISIGKVTSTTVSNMVRTVKAIVLGKNPRTALYAGPFGEDSVPPQNTRAIVVQGVSSDSKVVIAYINRNQLDSLAEGEKRIYSVKDDGSLSTDIILRSDGTMEIGGNTDFLVRYSKLKEEYDKTKDALDSIINILSGSPINEAGNGSPSSLQAALKTALTGKSTGDISSSKIEEIKTK